MNSKELVKSVIVLSFLALVVLFLFEIKLVLLYIFIALILLSILGGAGLYFGHIEVTTGCTGGVIALSMKLLENE